MAAENEVWILRHGEAEPASGPDGERRLTPAGEAAASAVGSSLAARGLRAVRVLSSPLLRARRTAALAAAAMAAPGAPPPPVETDRRLAPGGDAGDLVEDLAASGDLPALLVGHNPDLEGLVRALTGTPVPLSTAALVRIALGEGRGRILERP